MSKDLKFRAWDKTSDTMIFKPTMVIDSGELIEKNCFIMQYTGLKDKNGKEIYEGDRVVEIINTENGDDKIEHEVTFTAGAFYPICMQPSTTFEIIGNIYENPELLKQPL